jgi:hypothetical protein
MWQLLWVPLICEEDMQLQHLLTTTAMPIVVDVAWIARVVLAPGLHVHRQAAMPHNPV